MSSSFSRLTAQQNIRYAQTVQKAAIGKYIAGGGLQPLVGEAALAGWRMHMHTFRCPATGRPVATGTARSCRAESAEQEHLQATSPSKVCSLLMCSDLCPGL